VQSETREFVLDAKLRYYGYKSQHGERYSGMEKSGIVIIGGFLGSGKTTLLKKLLEWEFERGTRPQVIMSEFGDFDVDGTIIGDDRIDISAIVSGCICCGSRDELADALTGMLRSAPGSPIYIEATGVADPAGVLTAITPVIEVNGTFVRKVIVIHDASRHDGLDKDAVLVERQLMAADHIILNKCDLVPDKVDSISEELAAVNPAAIITRTVACTVDPEEITQGVTAVKAGLENEHGDDQYSSFAFQLESRLSRTALEKWLASLPSTVLRVKGFVRLQGQNGLFEVQATQGQSSITPFPTRGWQDSVLVAITHPMPAEELVRGFQDCVTAQETT
jgi:G3E family GTPase